MNLGNPLFGQSPIEQMLNPKRDRGYFYDRGFKFGLTEQHYYSFP